MKQKHPGAIFIQILGSSGVGKSSLMNALCAGAQESRAENFEEIFKTGNVETTRVTQFHKVTDFFLDNMTDTKLTWLEEQEEEYDLKFPDIFLCDQPGIGGQITSAKNYFKNFSPGHYDYSIAATADRILENEYFLMMHLQKCNKPYVIVRTKVDSALDGKFSRREISDRKLVADEFEQLKKNFENASHNLKSVATFYYGLPFPSPEKPLIDFDDAIENIREGIVQIAFDSINKFKNI